ncbi:MAG TPA: TlpA disulfide reductase family protein [Terriglobales bacterium]
MEALAWIALVAFLGYRIWPQVAAAFGVASANATVPAFQLTTLDGRAVTSDQLRGKVVLVNFWATWCPPCRIEMPGFQAVYDRNRSRGFVVLGISTDASGSESVRAFLAEHQITYPVAMASASVIQGFGRPNVLPTSFLIDRQGRIRNEVRGAFASMALERAIDHLLAEAPEGKISDHASAEAAR